MMNLIDHPADQIGGFSSEVAFEVDKIRNTYDCTFSEAIEIVRIGAYNILTETLKYNLNEIAQALQELGESHDR